MTAQTHALMVCPLVTGLINGAQWVNYCAPLAAPDGFFASSVSGSMRSPTSR